jgi:undecaprenyl-diphosphatase
MTPTITYVEALVVGVVQGVSELFPVSSLGHSVLLPALLGGSWARDLSMAGDQSPYLALLVAMHVATALALVVYFWRDWVRLIGALVASVARRRVRTVDERLAWLLVLATVPVGLVGLLLEHALRGVLGQPIPAAAFLTLNGVVLYGVERTHRHRVPASAPGVLDVTSQRPGRSTPPSEDCASTDGHAPGSGIEVLEPGAQEPVAMPAPAVAAAQDRPLAAQRAVDQRLSQLSVREAVMIGSAQCLALLPGFSRSGVTIGAGLLAGLRRDQAARFAFLLATPVILAAGLLKIPELFTPAHASVLGPALVGSLVAGLSAYASVRFLSGYFESRTRTLTPFAVYCIVAGLGSLAYLITTA